MKIVQVSISNYRNIDGISVVLDKDSNYIIGENNIGMLKQYYILNEKTEYKIAYIKNKKISEPKKKGTIFVPIHSIEQWVNVFPKQLLAKSNPYIDYNYIEHRYFKHPYYQYKVYGLQRNGNINGIFVAREETQFGNKVLRIVDYHGVDEELSYAGEAFKFIMDKESYEYIDFYCYGIEHEVLCDAGFVLRTEDDENIIPNHFSPYERKNIEIYFFTWFMDGVHVYRGFGDQDRPSFI